MRTAGLLTLSLLGGALAGCSSSGTAGKGMSAAGWAQAVAARGVDPALVADPTSATPEMARAARRMAGPGTVPERLWRLQQALVDRRDFAFERELGGTFTAKEAFRERRGNCVSFTNLFIALGRSLGISLNAAIVKRRPESEKHGELVVIYSHMVAVRPVGYVSQVYDFWGQGSDPSAELVPLTDVEVAGIGFGNSGVAKIEAGDLAGASADLSTAVKLAPRLPGLWANLGLSRWRSGDADGALSAYAQGLAIDPGSPPVLQNLALLYSETGRGAEARAALAAASSGEETPYTLIARADLEMAARHYQEALHLFTRVRRMAPRLAEGWVGMARAERALGHLDAARKAALRARKLAPSDPDVERLVREIEAPGLDAPGPPPSESPSPRAGVVQRQNVSFPS
jgi:Flp pilus assembly protein TadD